MRFEYDVTGPLSIAPDCSWTPMTHNSCLPEDVVFHNGELNGDKVYVGRVNDGKCVYVGTAIPDKGICIYLDKNLQVHSSQDYEVLYVTLSLSSMYLVYIEKSIVFVFRINFRRPVFSLHVCVC